MVSCRACRRGSLAAHGTTCSLSRARSVALTCRSLTGTLTAAQTNGDLMLSVRFSDGAKLKLYHQKAKPSKSARTEQHGEAAALKKLAETAFDAHRNPNCPIQPPRNRKPSTDKMKPASRANEEAASFARASVPYFNFGELKSSAANMTAMSSTMHAFEVALAGYYGQLRTAVEDRQPCSEMDATFNVMWRTARKAYTVKASHQLEKTRKTALRNVWKKRVSSASRRTACIAAMRTAAACVRMSRLISHSTSSGVGWCVTSSGCASQRADAYREAAMLQHQKTPGVDWCDPGCQQSVYTMLNDASNPFMGSDVEWADASPASEPSGSDTASAAAPKVYRTANLPFISELGIATLRLVNSCCTGSPHCAGDFHPTVISSRWTTAVPAMKSATLLMKMADVEWAIDRPKLIDYMARLKGAEEWDADTCKHLLVGTHLRHAVK